MFTTCKDIVVSCVHVVSVSHVHIYENVSRVHSYKDVSVLNMSMKT